MEGGRPPVKYIISYSIIKRTDKRSSKAESWIIIDPNYKNIRSFIPVDRR